MTTSPDTHSQTIRIGGASAFWGDSSVGAPQLLEHGAVDYLVFDYLAETTMAILSAQRRRDPDLGYATDFVEVTMKPLLPEIARQRVKVISNAGGLNPAACAAALRALIDAAGLPLTVAVVEGDDVSAQLDAWRAAGVTDTASNQPLPDKVLSANAYLGAFPIAQALKLGADIVVTGRCVDSAVTLGALIHEFGWQPDGDWDRLAQGSLAGHLIECACQATGGLHTDWQDVPDWPNIGYPVVEVSADGRFALSKPPGTGGRMLRAAVVEQLLYEIGDPADYRLPDVTCDFTQVRIEQDGADVVRVEGARGRPPPPTLKVSLTWADGWRCAGSMVIIGIDAAAKARRTGEAILERTRRLLNAASLADFSATRIEAIGAETIYGPHARTTAVREVMLRVIADHPAKDALQIFAREVAPSGTSWSPGTTSPGAGRPPVQPVIRQLGVLCPRSGVEVKVSVVTSEPVPVPWQSIDPAATPAPIAAAAMPPDPPATGGPLIECPLVQLAWARSGDKGNLVNIGVIARRTDWLPWIAQALSTKVVGDYFAHLVKGQVDCYHLPGVHALNFVLHDALDGGGTSSMRMDPLGKGFAQMLLDLPVRVPAALFESNANKEGRPTP